jgi:hypothetical protein
LSRARRGERAQNERQRRKVRLALDERQGQAADDRLQMWPVSKRVNSSRTPGDDPTLIEEMKDAA